MRTSRRNVLAALLLSTALLIQACTFNFSAAARTVARSADEAIPVVQSLVDSGECPKCANIVATLGRVREDASALATAFDSGNNATALQKAASITRALEILISTDAKLIPASKRTLVLAVLAAADLAISEISNHIQQSAPAASRAARVSNADAAVLAEYAKKPRLRARNSQTGRFVSLAFAKAHPDITTVERY